MVSSKKGKMIITCQHQLYLKVFTYYSYTINFIGDEKQRLDFMRSIGAVSGPKLIVGRSSIYKDVIELYQGQNIVN